MGRTYLEQQKCSTRYNLLGIARTGHQRCSLRKDVLRNFTKFTGKQLYHSLFFNKVPGLRPFSQNTSWQLQNSRNNLLCITYSEQQNILLRITYSEQQEYSNIVLHITYWKLQIYSTLYNLLRMTRFYSVYRVILGIRTPLGSSECNLPIYHGFTYQSTHVMTLAR